MILGLVAGAGSFPLLLAQKAKARGVKTVAVGFEGITSGDLTAYCDAYQPIRLGELSRMLGFFRREGVQGVILAGTVDHAHALRARDKLRLLADPRALKMVLGVKERKAQPLLLALIAEIEQEGMRVLPSFSYIEEELLKPGPLGSIRPSEENLRDIRTGFVIAKELARQDVGLTCCVRHGAVLAVEAMEGTNACIRRAGAILRERLGADSKGGFVVVKVARPKQDPRFDLPVLGPQTIGVLHEAGATLIAAEASWTLLLERQSLIETANSRQIGVFGATAD
ncbi:MAG: UDP-2,3-diacylglucosamine diphosphatase LpxI [Elusimicrobia bacterium]|nr:UDP-2,3-diacylglucosamine diphosphatase LpxI [Elusimicrobiota bacterium]